MKRFLSVILAIVISFSTLISVTFAANDSREFTIEDLKPQWPIKSDRIFYLTGIDYYKSGGKHNGIDIGNNGGATEGAMGEDIYPVEKGVVSSTGYDNSMGYYVKVTHTVNGKKYYSRYMHFLKGSIPSNIKEGVKVYRDTVLGRMGNTGQSGGTHLHFDIANTDSGSYEQLSKIRGYTFDYYINNPSALKNVRFSASWDSNNGSKKSCYWSWIVSNSDKINGDYAIKTHTCPTTPKNNKGQWNFQTKGSKLGACKACGKEYDWLSKIQPIINKKATLKSSKKSYKVTLYKKPYEDAGKAASGKVIKELPVTGTVKNAYGTDWYEVEYQKNKKGYITKTTLEKNYDIGSVSDKSAKKTSTQQESAKSTLKISLTQYPSQHTQGNNFGLRGTVTSNYKITSVKGTVVDSKGKTQLSSNDKPNATSMDIKTSALNNSLSFNKLPVGKYTLKIVAVDSSGKKVEDSKTFTVKAKANQSNSSKKEKTVKGTVKIPSSWDNLSIRKGPSTSYKIVGSMKNGAKCTVYPDKTKDGWYYVKYNDVEGYAAGNRINLQ